MYCPSNGLNVSSGWQRNTAGAMTHVRFRRRRSCFRVRVCQRFSPCSGLMIQKWHFRSLAQFVLTCRNGCRSGPDSFLLQQPEHHSAESVPAETLTVGTAFCESHALIFASDVVVDLPGVITPHRSVPPSTSGKRHNQQAEDGGGRQNRCPSTGHAGRTAASLRVWNCTETRRPNST